MGPDNLVCLKNFRFISGEAAKTLQFSEQYSYSKSTTRIQQAQPTAREIFYFCKIGKVFIARY